MRALVLTATGAALLFACNALTGVGDLSVCDECLLDAGPASPDDGGATDGGAPPEPPPEPPGPPPPEPPPVGGCSGEPKDCYGRVLATCSDGTWVQTTCPELCEDGACVPYKSCRNASGASCGVAQTSCCETEPVAGGTFYRQNDTRYPATVSAFALDAYEVTVGRFRAFVEAGGGVQDNPPAPGAGAHPKIYPSGWQQGWDKLLFSSLNTLKKDMRSGTWTDAPEADELKPITRVPWGVAFAFCAWDGGRLPTYAEWSFAASGGDEQRVYPWSSPPTSTAINASNAAYACGYVSPSRSCIQKCSANDATPCDATACTDLGGTCVQQCTGCNADADIAPVGMLPAGVGRYGHFDLAGNVAELTFDAVLRNLLPGGSEALPVPCVDCAPVMGAPPEQSAFSYYEVFAAGGSWSDEQVKSSTLARLKYSSIADSVGFRCARDVSE